MIGVVIVAHGGLAREYKLAVEHVLGVQEGFVAIGIEKECSRSEKQTEIRKAVERVDQGDGVVVVTDLFGGSPSNLSLCTCDRENRKILYGANLPMLVKLTKSRRKEFDLAVRLAVEAGRKYINSYDAKNG